MENKRHFLFEIDTFSDEDGVLNVIQENKQVPFVIRRVFYEYKVNKNSMRGKHANLHSRFCMVAVSGSCDVIVEDGHDKMMYKLDKPNKILYLDSLIWKTMTNFSNDCVLLVLSDHLYDKDEYIRSFDNYLKIINSKSF